MAKQRPRLAQQLSRRALVDRRFRAPKRLARKSPIAVANGGSPRWQEYETLILRLTVKAGMTGGFIAAQLKRSRSSVLAKARRLGLKLLWATEKRRRVARTRNRARRASQWSGQPTT